MTPFLRRGGAISGAVHFVLLLALILALPFRTPDKPMEETAVTVEFEGPAVPVQRSQDAAPTPALTPAPTQAPEPRTTEPPRPTPPAPPPPPPPPPPPAPPLPPTPAPPTPIPPTPVPVAPVPTPPAPPQAQPVPVAPETPALAPLPLPPIRPAPPAPPRPAAPAPPAPVPPTPPAPRPALPTPTPGPPHPSTTSQPNPTRTPAPDSRSLENTLERLRALRQQTEPPPATYNPPRGGTPGGGSPSGVDNAQLSAAIRGAIGDRLRECWTGDKGALDYNKQMVRLVVTTDPSGTIRVADIAANDASRTGGGVARAFAERARRAALDPQCAQLPLPGAMKGQNHTFEITFRP